MLKMILFSFLLFFVKPQLIEDVSVQWRDIGSCTHWCETGWYSSPAYALSTKGVGMVVGAAYSIYAINVETGKMIWKNDPPCANCRSMPGVVRVYDFQEKGDLCFVTAHSGGYVCSWSESGEKNWCTQVSPGDEIRGIAVGKLKKDEYYHVFAGVAASRNYDLLYVLNSNGNVEFSRPRNSDDSGYPDGWCWYQCNDNIAVSDVTDDGDQEVIQPCDTHYVTAYDHEMEPLHSNEKYNAQGEHDIWGRVGFNQYEAVDIRGWGHDGLRPNFCHGAATVFDYYNSGTSRKERLIAISGNYHDIDTNVNQYHTVFVVEKDRNRFIDASNGFNWTYTPDNPHWIENDYSRIQSVMPDIAAIDIDDDGYPELIYPNNDGYLHCNWLDKEEKYNWPYKVTTPDPDRRFASPVVAFRFPASVGGDVLSRTMIVFASWGMHADTTLYSNGMLHFLDGRGNHVFTREFAPSSSSALTDGSLGSPTLFYHLPKTSNLLVTVQTINSGNILFEVNGTENCDILWATGRGSYFRDGRNHPADESNDSFPNNNLTVGEILGLFVFLPFVVLVSCCCFIGSIVVIIFFAIMVPPVVTFTMKHVFSSNDTNDAPYHKDTELKKQKKQQKKKQKKKI